MVPASFLRIEGGIFWLDNVYLLLQRSTPDPAAAFVSAGATLMSPLVARFLYPEAPYTRFVRKGPALLYMTNVTFQAEHRGSARGVALQTAGSSALL